MKDISELLTQHSFDSSINHVGPLAGIKHFSGAGQLHLLEKGAVKVYRQGGNEVLLDKPSLLFMPKPVKHHIESISDEPAQLISASIKFHVPTPTLVLNALPDELYLELSHDNAISWTIKWLLDEVREHRFGKSTMIDRLGEMFMLQVLRYATEHGQLHQGTLLAINHPQLSKVIDAIHADPARNWTLESLAQLGAMSRSKFAESFKDAVGQTANDYITSLRLAMAQKLLKAEKSVNYVAYEVGYEHGSALARVFRKKLGVSPMQWLQQENNQSLVA
ncbi:AraC family transcriptional regulator [Alteromonas sp. McT4-15]|uniref:helix-turn-helix domain-containing protein n=1 Tax=Alteromonas sp. McT4-15 TaxID=2881256 RepID=UPI001CF85F7E|nr:AraC family transcriptional regulator [Alteromonas sp. McT4-15]MCB4438185.1 AraC family transcriptional regulator [Alteromonas sp. McT4-15]MEC8232718.1 AraC family transcriptional regulator [Pseudomonadota bacterium]